MKKKNILATALAGLMLALAPATGIGSSLAPSLGLHGPSIAYAAKGGARLAPSAPKVSPKPSAPKATTPSNNGKSVSGNGGSYAPSKSAKDLGKDAPSANSKSNANANAAAGTTQSTSRLGSVLRGVGLLAGGMFLGSMLGGLLGFGGGFLSDMLGILMNVVLFMVAFMAIRWLLSRFLGRKNNNNAQSNWQQTGWGNAQQNQPPTWNSAPRTQQTNAANGPLRTIDITSTESRSTNDRVNGSDAKRIADKYRNL